MKTFSTRLSNVQPKWHVFDASGKTLGRLATEVAVLLQGKHKPIYARHLLTGDYVVVVNSAKVRVTGAKLQQKQYRHHSQYPGGLRETSMAEVQATHPNRIIRAAVRGMLPRNTLGRHMLQRLKVYAGDSHPHGSQVAASAKVEAKPPSPVAQAAPTAPVQAEAQEVERSLETRAEAATEEEAEE